MTKGRRKAPPITDEEEARIQAGIASDPDAPELTDEQLARMRPASEVLPPALYKALTRRGRPRAENKRLLTTLRIDPAVLDAYRATGDGWQTRMHKALEAGVTGILKKLG